MSSERLRIYAKETRAAEGNIERRDKTVLNQKLTKKEKHKLIKGIERHILAQT